MESRSIGGGSRSSGWRRLEASMTVLRHVYLSLSLWVCLVIILGTQFSFIYLSKAGSKSRCGRARSTEKGYLRRAFYATWDMNEWLNRYPSWCRIYIYSMELSAKLHCNLLSIVNIPSTKLLTRTALFAAASSRCLLTAAWRCKQCAPFPLTACLLRHCWPCISHKPICTPKQTVPAVCCALFADCETNQNQINPWNQ